MSVCKHHKKAPTVTVLGGGEKSILFTWKRKSCVEGTLLLQDVRRCRKNDCAYMREGRAALSFWASPGQNVLETQF